MVLTFGRAQGGWRNGRRARFRSVCPQGREGSNPSSPTEGYRRKSYSYGDETSSAVCWRPSFWLFWRRRRCRLTQRLEPIGSFRARLGVVGAVVPVVVRCVAGGC